MEDDKLGGREMAVVDCMSLVAFASNTDDIGVIILNLGEERRYR